MKKSISRLAAHLSLVVFLLFLSSCGDGGDSGSTNGEPEVAVDPYKKISIFDSSAGGIVFESISMSYFPYVLRKGKYHVDAEPYEHMTSVSFSLPSHNTRDMDIENVDIDFGGSGGGSFEPSSNENQAAFYEAARACVAAADNVRYKMKYFLISFFPSIGSVFRLEDGEWLEVEHTDDDLPLTLPPALVAKYGLHKILIESLQNHEYAYKISLYYYDDSLEPEAALFLSIRENGARGRMFMKMDDEEDKHAAAVGVEGLKLVRKIEAVFNGRLNPQIFEFKYTGDRAEARNHAAANWNDLDAAARDALTKVPEKVLLRASYDGESREFSVYGAAWHPGWGALEDLEGRPFWSDKSRTLYMFKAKERSDGAKLALALPLESTPESNVWEKELFGDVFADETLLALNSVLYKLNDDTDDSSDDGLIYLGGSRDEELRARLIYNCVMRDCEIETEPSIPSNPDAVITRDKLEKFARLPPSTDLFGELEEFHDRLKPVAYMGGEGFFRYNVGFIGIMSENIPDAESTFYRYDYSDYSGGDFTKQSGADIIEDLLNISLDDVGSYAPEEIIAADIALE